MSEVIAAFSLKQACGLTGLSEAQLIEWDVSDFFAPSYAYENRRSPYSRIYSFEDIVGLRTLCILRDRVSMQHLREAAEKLKQHAGKPWSQLALYTLKDEVHFKRPGTGTIEGAVSGQYGATIPLESVAEEMRIKAAALKKRDPKSIGKTSSHRHIMGGALVIDGTRIPVSSILAFADAGYSSAKIIEEYPSLTRADVKRALSQGRLTQAA